MKKMMLFFLSSVICTSLYCAQEQPESLQEQARSAYEPCEKLLNALTAFGANPDQRYVEEIINGTQILIHKIPALQKSLQEVSPDDPRYATLNWHATLNSLESCCAKMHDEACKFKQYLHSVRKKFYVNIEYELKERAVPAQTEKHILFWSALQAKQLLFVLAITP